MGAELNMNSGPKITTISLPIPWTALDFPDPLQLGETSVTFGDIAWAWSPNAPRLAIQRCDESPGRPVDGWTIDHVVLLVPNLEVVVAEVATSTGMSPGLTMKVQGRPAAYYRVGPVLEVIESPVRSTALHGIGLVTTEPLEVLALRWRSMGRDVSGPEAAIQPGRRVLTLRDTEAGLAVMSPNTAVAVPDKPPRWPSHPAR
jgi:hypothetical protein